MTMISENYQKKKLNKLNLNIKTKYIVENKILERNTNDTINNDIKNGIVCEKQYFHNEKLLHVENFFDTRMKYTFISKNIDEEYRCSNCGVTSKLKDFIDCCPYCGTYYNIDYDDKKLGNKDSYDYVLNNNEYKKIMLIADIVISMFASYSFVKKYSRTFNGYDIGKVFVYGVILALIIYGAFYLFDSYCLINSIKKYKETQNKKQIRFWNETK